MSSFRIVPRGDVDLVGEGLFWSARDGALYWTDLVAPALNRVTLSDGRVERRPLPEMIGWVIEREQERGFVAGFRSGFAELCLNPFSITPIAAPEPDRPGNRLNDAKADRHGRIWAGTMPVSGEDATGALYRLDPDRTVHRMDDGYLVVNGPAFSPDDRWLYHTDTRRGTIYRFALASDGSLSDRRVHIRFAPDWGKPDGMTTDAEGFLWVASWGGARVFRFTPGGSLDRWIELPAKQITNVCFAGDGLDRMFVTSAAIRQEGEQYAGALFEVEAGVRGLPPHRFAG